MARKITMFELHFDGVHFGGSAGDSTPEPVTDDYDTTETGDDESGRSVGKLVLGMVLTSVVVSVVASRLAKRFGGDEEGTDVEFEELEDTADAPAQ